MDTAVGATSTQAHRLSLERIAHASSVIDPVFLDTPQFESDSLGRQLGCRLVVKAESLTDLTVLADDILLVEDETLIAAMRLAHRELGLVLEPSGAAGLAALLTHREQFRDKLVATILTGGNLTPEQMRRWLSC